MNRTFWLSLLWCSLTSFVFPSDTAKSLSSLCVKILHGPQKIPALDCTNAGLKDVPIEILNTTYKRIHLSENPYLCDCFMVWFLEKLRKKLIPIEIVDLDRMACTTPIQLAGRQIKDLKKGNVCPSPEEVKRCLHLECSKFATCVNKKSIPFGKCVCNAGLTGNGRFCEDIDECSLGSHTCAGYQNCQNTFGSFKCSCKSGFKRGSKGHCEAPEPCEILLRPCDSKKEVCINKKRSYECACKEGYQRESEAKKECKDVNECQQRHSCSTQAWCINKIGSYQCLCKNGYAGDGKNCEDIDECETGEHNCPKEAVCVNSLGGFKCHCKSGYEMNKNRTLCIIKRADEKSWLKKQNIIYGGAGVAVLLMLTVCCCCYCCRRRSKKPKTESKEKLIGDKAMKANKDLMNMAMEQDPFLLKQQQDLEQQMYMFNMQQQQNQYMPYFGGNEPAAPVKDVTWSDEGEYMEYYADPDYDD